MKQRRKYGSTFFGKVLLAAIEEDQSFAELTKKFEVSGEMISRWREELNGFI